MKKNIELDTGKKIFPLIFTALGIILMLSLWILRLNIVAVVSVAFMCIMSAVIALGLIIKKKVYAPLFLLMLPLLSELRFITPYGVQMQALEPLPRDLQASPQLSILF